MKNRNFISFKPQLVEAILAGNKTQTRRLIKPQPKRQPSPADMPYQPGDRPYVRESIWQHPSGAVAYGDRPDISYRFVSSMFMPKVLSRCTIEILDVRVQQLRDISQADATAEGMLPNWTGDLADWDPEEHGYLPLNWRQLHGEDLTVVWYSARKAFLITWDFINPANLVESNPWVVAYTFKDVTHANQE